MGWRSALLGFASLIVFFAAFEGVVRLASPDLTLPAADDRFRFDQATAAERPTHVRDDRLGWRLAPGQTTGMTTNSRGFRCEEFDEAKPPGTYRIVVAGDSNPLGFGLTDDDAPYPARLQHLLERFYSASAGRRFEVINLAVDGYSSHQVRLQLEEWLPRLAPDLLCVQVGFNDYCVSSVPDARMRFGRPWILDALEVSHAYRWLRRTLLGALGRTGTIEDPVPRVAPERYAENLDAITGGAARVGAETVLLTTPVSPEVPLVVNEVSVVEDGARRWVTQDRWIKNRLVEAGVAPPDQPGRDEYVRVVERAAEAHPDWPLLPYMLAQAARARGDLASAAVYEQRWRRLDTERAILGRYGDALREVATAAGAHVLDVRDALVSYEGESGTPVGSLFIDFVHLGVVGHVVVATELTRVVVEEVLTLDAVPSPSGGASP
jgi:lysophospholipase L1-like esterase